MREVISTRWNNITKVTRNFQQFLRSIINEPLYISRCEEYFRLQHYLCEYCGNHCKNYGTKCELHPLYTDIKISNNSMLCQCIKSFLISTSTLAITTFANDHSMPLSSSDNALNKFCSSRKQEMMAKSGEKAPSRLIISAEIMTPDESWLPATVAISTHSQKKFYYRCIN